MINDTFGVWLRQRRELLDLTREELATQVGCSVATLRKWENGGRRPSKQVAERLAVCLQLTIDEIPSFISFARGTVEAATLQTHNQTTSELKTLSIKPPAVSITPLIGRDDDMNHICTLIQDGHARLVTLVGPPGVGKTRLSLEVAQQMTGQFPDGVTFIPLATVSEPAMLVSTIAQILGITQTNGQSIQTTVTNTLHEQRLLLVLDNFEHIIEAATIVHTLLTEAHQITVLVTSRMPLNISGEFEYNVLPLRLPDQQSTQSVEHLQQIPAVQLLVQRIQAVCPRFVLTDENALFIAEICRRLDGLPLALELTAVQTKRFSLKALLHRLNQRFTLLIDGPRNLPPHQRTLQNTLMWSYTLLNSTQQRIFACLAVCVGGCRIEMAKAICKEEHQTYNSVVQVLYDLVDYHLLVCHEDPDGEPRFTMLETIREFAFICLREQGNLINTQQHYLYYCVELAEQAQHLSHYIERSRWFEHLLREQDNLRAALLWGQEVRDIAMTSRLSTALCWLWNPHKSSQEEHPLTYDNNILALWAATLNATATIAMKQRDYMQAHGLLTTALNLNRLQGHHEDIATTLNNLGLVALDSGNWREARPLFEESLRLRRECGVTHGIAKCLNNLAIVAELEGKYDQACTLLEESIVLKRTVGDIITLSKTHNNLGHMYMMQGHYQEACVHFEEGLILARETSSNIANCLEEIAYLALRLGHTTKATYWSGTVAQLRNEMKVMVCKREQDYYEKTLSEARNELGSDIFDKVWAEGRAASIEHIIEEALVFVSSTKNSTAAELVTSDQY